MLLVGEKLIIKQLKYIMSERTKKRHIDTTLDIITIMGKRFVAPRKTLNAIITLISSNPDVKEELTIPYDEIVADKIKKIGKGAMALKGVRSRENITQKQLAKRLGLKPVVIADIENGYQKISLNIAKQLDKLFNINYKVFLH